jgi:hypothetical protein
MRQKFLPVALVLLMFGFVSHSVASQDPEEATPPQFTYWQEIWLEHVFKPFEKHKAYALGLANYDYYSYGYETPAEAKEEALNGCRDSVREAFGRDADTQCQLVMEDDRLVWPAQMPRPMTENYLSEPDLPLARANVFNDIAPAKAIVLALHGCDGQTDPEDEWFKSWLDFFLERQYAVISPSSFADQQEILCGDNISNVDFDPVIRLRVAQTLRTIDNLKKRYPGKPIILWGYGSGGIIAQMIHFDVKGAIISAAQCFPAPRSSEQPLLHVVGSGDGSMLPDGAELPVTPKEIEAACTDYSKKGVRRFVIVEQEDSWIAASDPQVNKSLEEFLDRLPN